MSDLITPQVIRAIVPGHTHPTVTAKKLSVAAQKFGINTPLRLAHFLAQLAHESNIMPIEENLNYSAKALCRAWPNRFAPGTPLTKSCTNNPMSLANYVYGNRMGNTLPGDGYKFRGRGMIQLTGKYNYGKYGKAIGYDLVANPDLLKQFGISALVAAAYWQDHGLNEAADRDDIVAVTKGINGGTIGLQHRKQMLRRAKNALGIK